MTFEEELEQTKNSSIKRIGEYLKSRSDIAMNLMKPNKTLSEMYEYIQGEAKKQAENGCACIEDCEVFNWAVHYYDEDDIKISKEEPTVMKNGKVKKVTIENNKMVLKDIPKKEKNLAENQMSLFEL